MFTLGEMFSAFMFGMLSTCLVVTIGEHIEKKQNKRTARRQAIQSR